jgi:TRAP-type C4-dicarboxylate transport system permease small subunit
MEYLSMHSGWFAGSMAFVMMAAVIREVGGRYFFNAPTDWAVDLNAFLMVGLVYLGSAYTTINDGHVRADFFYARILGRKKALLDIFIDIICLFYVGVLIWQGWLLAYESIVYSAVSSGGVRWPLFPFQLLVPIGGVLVVLCLLVRMFVNIRSLFGKGKPFEPKGPAH